ncbi:hypothetical protein [Pseudonocardia acidicola]|uniref:RNA-binding S4 domain-containing protein n=1 Tax=Pseudonocardia acidicola TaxID=2724939 RepID=A0ABX1S6M1_9PSEU|nr:hypothetical protein [Pseudonocardia acidicola]NMH96569.1 hypothetical protein [Pseudonocardia acidicola]
MAEDGQQVEKPRTVRERVLAAKMNPERFESMLAAGRVWLNGEPVTDPDTPAPPGTSIAYGPA